MSHRAWSLPVVLSYGAFILVGVSAGVGGVLLPAQIRDYDVDMVTIGLTFFTFSAGFFLAGASVGALLARLGTRSALLVGGAGYLVATLITATRPSFVVLVVVQLLVGYGMGVLESVLNVYLASLPSATVLLNRLHAFFGVGALLGPLLAARMLRSWPWTSVFLVLAALTAVLLVGFAVVLPPNHEPAARPAVRRSPRDGLLAQVLRSPAVMLAAGFLAVYVGLEVSVGNWAYTYLVEGQGRAALAAGYAVSAYWLGLTVGRFVISPLAVRLGLTPQRMMLGCLLGVVGATALTWAVPGSLAGAGFALVGFFLGPLFPTAMALMPDLAPAPLVPTAIGVLNAVSVVGGAGLPWLAGAIAQGVGIWTLLPFVVVLGVLQLVLWQAAVAQPSATAR
ncbi:MFS transporter [Pengzhenrongella frigida]|uniref:MFS transporter n=2 Tax=Pengzhenrongella frigida TaxID=1259133 RepID=A0A4Q5N3W0_9MICO|nr:MFS transporter [Cellulomonas sp. HLT2-17]